MGYWHRFKAQLMGWSWAWDMNISDCSTLASGAITVQFLVIIPWVVWIITFLTCWSLPCITSWMIPKGQLPLGTRGCIITTICPTHNGDSFSGYLLRMCRWRKYLTVNSFHIWDIKFCKCRHLVDKEEEKPSWWGNPTCWWPIIKSEGHKALGSRGLEGN